MFETIWIILSLVGVSSIPFLILMDRLPRRSRAMRPELYPWADCDYRTDPPKVLDYGYIDWLERELEIGKYSPAAKELDARMAAEESARVAEELRAKKAKDMEKRAKRHAELVEQLRARGENFPVSEANRLLGWFSNGKLDPTVWRPGMLRRDYNIETGETTDIRTFGT